MKAKHQFVVFIGSVVLAFVVFGTLAFSTLNALKVNGPYYEKIVRGKDLVADILPPPEYVLEAYLVAHQMADPPNRPFLAGLVAQSEKLRQDYDDRHTFWVKNLPASTPGEKRIKQAMVEDSYQPAMRFLNGVHDKFLPVVQRGDYQAADLLLHGPLKQDYEAHRTAINQVVTLTNTNNQIIEADVERIIDARLVTLGVLGIAIIVATTLGIRRFLQGAISEAVAEKTDALRTFESAPHASNDQLHEAFKTVGDLRGHISASVLSAALESARNSAATLALLENQERGFHLVGGEIRNLAGENTKLLQQISRLVECIQDTGSAKS